MKSKEKALEGLISSGIFCLLRLEILFVLRTAFSGHAKPFALLFEHNDFLEYCYRGTSKVGR